MKMKCLLSALTLAVAGAAWAGQPVNETRPVTPGAEIEIESLEGSLVIEGWDRDFLEITGILGDGVERLDIDSDDEGISIEVVFDEDFHGRQVDSTNLSLRLPRGAGLSAETVSASISVAGMRGDVELESVSGIIGVAGMPATLEAESVSGKVEVDVAPPGAELASVSGNVHVANAQGELEASSVSGSIVIEGGTIDGGDFETVSGNITCRAVPSGNGDIDMETMSGTITLVVDPGMVARYEISTFSGSIKNALGPKPERTSRYAPGKELSFNTGSGGPRISMTSFSGSVKLLTK